MPQQIAGRFGTFALLPLLLGGAPILKSVFSDTKTFAAGFVNIFHVLESYKSFQLLPAGIAYTIIYTYPFWNLLGARLLFNEEIPLNVLPLFLLAFAGILCVTLGSQSMHVKSQGQLREGKTTSKRGIIAALFGAITETILYLIVRGSEYQNPLNNIARLYVGAAAMLLAGTSILQPSTLKELIATPLNVPIFNALIGFTSMSALVWSAKKIPTYIYSLIAFVGLIASYGWGLLFAQETPSALALIGSAIVAIAVWLLPSVPH